MVFAILTSLAIPSFNSMRERNQVLSLANDMTADLQAARSQAVLIGQTVNLCASNDGKVCSGSWNDGWIVINPISKEVHVVRGKIESTINVTGTASGNVIAYNGTGRKVPSGTESFTIKRGGSEYSVTVGLTGRSVVKKIN